MGVLTTTIRWGVPVILILLSSVHLAAAQQNIGATSIVVNRVTGDLEGDTRTLKLGSHVSLNEVIETSKDGQTQIIFDDETILSLAPLSKFILDEMVYDPNSGEGTLSLTLTVGAMRFISGALEKPENYKIKTPVGVIGIRGTVFDLHVAESGATTLVLRAGVVVFTNQAGQSQTLTQPGMSTTVITGTSTPTPPAPPPASVIQVLTGISGSGAALPSAPAQIGLPNAGIEGGAEDAGPSIPTGELIENTGSDAATSPVGGRKP